MTSIENHEASIERLRPLVESETGMEFSGDKFSRLCDAVEKVLGKTGDNIQTELDRIFAQPKRQGALLERLTAELTIGESFFLRNEHHFRALREHVVPAILKDNSDIGEIRVWSAGCATGEEPYSVAIVLDQILAQGRAGVDPALGPARLHHKVHILGTDLNAQFLDRARQARYRPWSFRQTEIHKNLDYFTVEGKDFCLASRIRKQVRFAYLNLVKDVYPSPLTGTLGLDLILFRNVAIYLKPEVTKAIIQRFHRALRPGGWLLLGETEVGTASSEDFEVHRYNEATFFRKRSDCDSLSDDALPMPVPPLATFQQHQPMEFAASPSVPDWMPLPKAAPTSGSPNSAKTEPSSVADSVHRLLQQRKFNEAERVIERIGGGNDRALARLDCVRGLLACAEIPRAHKMLEKCLDEEPLLIEAQLLKATFAEEDGDLDEAEQAYRRALYIDRKCTIAHFHLALLQKQTADSAGAKRSLEIALGLASDEDVHQVVPHGDGVCYGRLQEMIEGLLNSCIATFD